MSNPPEDTFGHAPSDIDDFAGGDLASFEEVDEAGEADGRGIALTRHDGFLVVEVADAYAADGRTLVPQVGNILDALGGTFLEHDEDLTGVRAFYTGALPDEHHGGPPIVLTLTGTGAADDPSIRLYDRGWTPVTGRHVDGTPEDMEQVNDTALAKVVDMASSVGESDE